MKTLIIIPARAGSKRLPGKNRMPLGRHKTLVNLSVEHAFFIKEEIDPTSQVIVTTDSQDIITLLPSNRRRKIHVIEREAILSGDCVRTEDVILDAIQKHVKLNPEDSEEVLRVVLLQPTSPFRRRMTLRKIVPAVAEDMTTRSIMTTHEGAPNGCVYVFSLMDCKPPRKEISSLLRGLFGLLGLGLLYSCRTIENWDPFENVDIDEASDYEIAKDIAKSLQKEATDFIGF